MRVCTLAAALMAIVATPASAQDRDFCANRPGIGTPACTMAPGTAMAEVGVAEWDHSANSASSEDTSTYGDVLLRVGVSASAELQVGFTDFTRDQVRDKASGLVTHSVGTGDAFLAVRHGLAGPNG